MASKAVFAVWLVLVVALGVATGYVLGVKTGNALMGLAGTFLSVATAAGLFISGRRREARPKSDTDA